jgi:dUTP pyrophosphatase
MPKPLLIPIQWLGKGTPRLPAYQSEEAAGMDLFMAEDTPRTLMPLERALIATGIAIALPQGYEAQIRPRSGLAWRHGLTILNAPGTIDADYRGEIRVLLINLSQEPVTLHPNDRIAQMVIAPVTRASWQLSEALPPSERADGGFGSTGSR